MTVVMGATIKYDGLVSGIKPREWNQIRKAGGHVMATEYHSEMLEVRFTPEGAKKLKFGKRKKGYQKIKATRKGHQNPLEWSGESKERVLGKLVDRTIARGDNFRVEVTLNAPALNFKNPHSDIRPSDEIRRVAPDETRKLEKTLGNEFEKRIKDNKESRTVLV